MTKNVNKIALGILTLILTGGLFSSCKKDDKVAPPDPIGGFNNSNEVGASSLKAHWTFDGSLNESISNTAPATSSGTSFVTGTKGQAVSLANGYILYPATIAALNTANIGSVTVSAWVKTDNNGSTASNVFALTQGTGVQTDWNTGVVTMYLETGHAKTTDDTLVLHSAFSTYATGTRLGGDNINDFGVRETDFKTVKGTNKWVHYVMRYDATGSNIDLFANGILVSNNNFRHRTTGTPAVGIGPIVTTTPAQALIGAFPNSTVGFTKSAAQPWQANFTGQIDEVRFWNSALSDADISALYQLELAGR
jgi:hypothetical protein